MRIGANAVHSAFWNHANIPVGRVNVFFLMIPVRLSPRKIMMSELAIPRIAERVKLTQKFFPTSPNTPPRSENPMTRPL